MINPDDLFKDDPIFTSLRSLVVQPTSDQIPQQLINAFKMHSIEKPRFKYTKRALFAFLAASLVLPSLSYAQLLPNSVDKVVKSVQQVLIAPIKAISELVVDLVTTPALVSPTTTDQDSSELNESDPVTENERGGQENPNATTNLDEDEDAESQSATTQENSPFPSLLPSQPSESKPAPSPTDETQDSEGVNDHNPLSNGASETPDSNND